MHSDFFKDSVHWEIAFLTFPFIIIIILFLKVKGLAKVLGSPENWKEKSNKLPKDQVWPEIF